MSRQKEGQKTRVSCGHQRKGKQVQQLLREKKINLTYPLIQEASKVYKNVERDECIGQEQLQIGFE
jgi:hypothetical protein